MNTCMGPQEPLLSFLVYDHLTDVPKHGLRRWWLPMDKIIGPRSLSWVCLALSSSDGLCLLFPGGCQFIFLLE